MGTLSIMFPEIQKEEKSVDFFASIFNLLRQYSESALKVIHLKK